MGHAALLLRKCEWKIEEVTKVDTILNAYADCPIGVIRTVLHRNDNDANAAMEMLKDFRQRVCAHVRKCAAPSTAAPPVRQAAAQGKGHSGTAATPKLELEEDDVASIATAAMSEGGWNPATVMEDARKLTDFVLQTRAICAKKAEMGDRYPVDSVL